MFKNEIESTINALNLEHLSKNTIKNLEKHLKEVLELQREYLAKQLDSQSAWQLGPTGHTVKECSCYQGFKINPRPFFEGGFK